MVESLTVQKIVQRVLKSTIDRLGFRLIDVSESLGVNILKPAAAAAAGVSNMTEAEYMAAVAEIKEHISAGDVFQLVLSQRFERRTFADPFEVYRALRVVNPSPYMVYMQVGWGNTNTAEHCCAIS